MSSEKKANIDETRLKELVADLRQAGVTHLTQWASELESEVRPLNPKLQVWIGNMVIYYGEKDRSYATWLESLLGDTEWRFCCSY